MMNSQVPDQAKDNRLLLETQNYVRFIVLSLLPVIGAYVYGAVASHSLSVMALATQCGVSFIADIFILIAMRSIVNANIFSFPYGTGKLENFIGFLTGTHTRNQCSALPQPTSYPCCFSWTDLEVRKGF
jgi:hypothetical protein